MELIPDTDPRLHLKCEPLNPRNPDFDLKSVLLDMFVLMREHNGIGLAAPQVGITKRFFVLQYEGESFICINPRVVKASKETQETGEGCLSYPGLTVPVRRPTVVRATYMEPSGLVRKHTFKGLLARAFLHELDHLNGVVLPDLLPPETETDVSRQHSGQTL